LTKKDSLTCNVCADRNQWESDAGPVETTLQEAAVALTGARIPGVCFG
jgi:hypothetical protein